MNLAGLLAWFTAEYLPVERAPQWYEDSAVEQRRMKRMCSYTFRTPFITHKPYSYGDSAGISPDFPFNDAGASTKYGAKMTAYDDNSKNK